MSRRKIKQVDGIRQKTLETVIEEFLRHCRLKNLSPRTLEYYGEDLNYFQRCVTVENVHDITREVMEDFIDHEMQKGNRITAINTRLRGLRVFLRFCAERGYMNDIGLSLLKEDETIKEPYDNVQCRLFPKQQNTCKVTFSLTRGSSATKTTMTIVDTGSIKAARDFLGDIYRTE